MRRQSGVGYRDAPRGSRLSDGRVALGGVLQSTAMAQYGAGIVQYSMAAQRRSRVLHSMAMALLCPATPCPALQWQGQAEALLSMVGRGDGKAR